MTAEETVLLAKKYRDHTRPGLCNYYSFHEDIERKQNGKNMDLFSNFTFTALLILLSCQPGWEGVYSLSYNGLPVILLQLIVMVSPGSHFVKNHDSLSITPGVTRYIPGWGGAARPLIP